MNQKGILVGLAALGVVASATEASRFSVVAGRTGGPSNGGATCMSCHGTTTGPGSVEIIGAPNYYQANAVYDISVRVTDPTRVGAGFQISVEDAAGNHIGQLSVIDPIATQLNSDDPAYLNHTSDGVDDSVADWAANGGSYSYPVRWTAPASDMGTVTFWAAGNAINNNSAPNGDLIYLTSKSASFVVVPALSTWGMVVLALSVMTAGTLLVIRQRSAAALAFARARKG